jgi:hypothetical protein
MNHSLIRKYTNCHRIATIQRKPYKIIKRLPTKHKASLQDIDSLLLTSYFVGKSITLFTMFYCSLNWWYYRSLQDRDRHDDDDEK